MFTPKRPIRLSTALFEGILNQNCEITGGVVMAAITIMDDANISMWYYPDTKILHHQIHRFFYGKPFRDALNKGVEVFQKYGARKWLSDDRAETALTPDDLKWGDEDWFPRVARCGWKYWAIVMPEKIVGQLTLKKLADKYSAQGVTTRIFSSVDEAKNWLEGCP